MSACRGSYGSVCFGTLQHAVPKISDRLKTWNLGLQRVHLTTLRRVGAQEIMAREVGMTVSRRISRSVMEAEEGELWTNGAGIFGFRLGSLARKNPESRVRYSTYSIWCSKATWPIMC